MENRKASHFQGMYRCNRFRESDLGLKGYCDSNPFIGTVTAKDILKGYLAPESPEEKFEIQDFAELIDEGCEDSGSFITEESRKRWNDRLLKCLVRYAQSETAHLHGQVLRANPGATVMPPNSNYLIQVNRADLVFINPQLHTVRVVAYRIGKSTGFTQKGKKEDASAKYSIELYSYLLYARLFVPEGETWETSAAFYYLRRTEDSDNYVSPCDFFEEHGKTVISLEEVYTGGQTDETELDLHFAPQLKAFEDGKDAEKCSEKVCISCPNKIACSFQKELEMKVKDKKEERKKKTFPPSEEQKRIIEANEGVYKVLADPGSGKTACITQRGAHLTADLGVPVENQLYISFTVNAAEEVKGRLVSECLQRGKKIKESQVNSMTYHALAYKIIKPFYRDFGYTAVPEIADNDPVRISALISEMLNKHVIPGLNYLSIDSKMGDEIGAIPTVESVFNIMKEENILPSDKKCAQKVSFIYRERFERSLHCEDYVLSQIIDLYDEFEKELVKRNLILFSEMEQKMHTVFDKHPEYLESLPWTHIVVDEFQDSNEVQISTLRRLYEEANVRSVMVVGDLNQSIYGFRGTSMENMEHFEEKIGHPVTVLTMHDNYRSCAPVCAMADAVRNRDYERHHLKDAKEIAALPIPVDMVAKKGDGKPVTVKGFHEHRSSSIFLENHEPENEYSWIAWKAQQWVKEDKGRDKKRSIGIIARKKSELIDIAAELSKRGIRSIMRCDVPIMTNTRVIAACSLADAFADPSSEMPFYDYLMAKTNGSIIDEDHDTAKNSILELQERFKGILSLEITEQRACFHELLDALKGNDEIYESFLELLYQNQSIEEELAYIKNLRLFGESRAMAKLRKDYEDIDVELFTAHGCKGLERDCVIVTTTSFWKADYVGSERQRAEARRLLYVAITRAKEELVLTGMYTVRAAATKDKTEAEKKKEEHTVHLNNFLQEVFEAAGQSYDPVDHRKPKPGAKKRPSKVFAFSGSELTEEEKERYDDMTRCATQTDLFSALKSLGLDEDRKEQKKEKKEEMVKEETKTEPSLFDALMALGF